jgi:hypothetical protein
MTPEEPVNGGPSAESYARLAQAQASFSGPTPQESVTQTLEQLRLERDATVSAGLPTRYNQQTLVGNVSGAGNRHVIEDTPASRRPLNIPSVISDLNVANGITVQTGPFSGGYAGVVNGVTTITFDETLFQIQDNGGGEVLVSLITTTCS